MSMDTPHFGLLFGATIAQHEAESSRPWAPQEPEPEQHRRARRVRAPRARRTLAEALHNLADAVAPANPGDGHPAR